MGAMAPTELKTYCTCVAMLNVIYKNMARKDTEVRGIKSSVTLKRSGFCEKGCVKISPLSHTGNHCDHNI